MSVLIKGMEMPKGSHEIIVRIQSDGRVLDQWGHRFNQEFIAVPVPPHGRLIDADALMERIEFEARHYVVKDEFDKGRVAAWNNVIRAIREYVPTIIPASEEGEA